MNSLQITLSEALDLLVSASNHSADALFGDRVLEPDLLPPSAAHAMGLIEGAAIALGLTPLELLDQVDAR